MSRRHPGALIATVVMAGLLTLAMISRGAREPGAAPETPPEAAAPSADGRSATGTAGNDMAGAASPTASRPANTPVRIETPPSLIDTEVDGGIVLDSNGRLLPTLELRRLFDQVLSTIGELDLDGIRRLLAERLASLTDDAGREQALAAFERYLRYLAAVDGASARLDALPLRERLEALSELRRQMLGPDMAEAFFGEEEHYQRYTLERQALAQDTTLGEAERAARERELTDALPDSLRQPLLDQRQVEGDIADATAIDTRASDPAERYRLRADRFGEEAAARMEMLDRERAGWDARVAAYQAERASIARNTPAGAAREAALEQYLLQHFSEPERRRIRSLEAVGAL